MGAGAAPGFDVGLRADIGAVELGIYAIIARFRTEILDDERKCACWIAIWDNLAYHQVMRMPKKVSGEIGPVLVTETLDGADVQLLHVDLPADKEGLERYFAVRFVSAFNQQRPLGPVIDIKSYRQNDTSDLDFLIDCPVADYLELAELNPRSEPFGRKAYCDGKLYVHEYSHWIRSKIISQKQRKYGSLAKKTFLLLYSTHWQFRLSDSTIDCLQSWNETQGVTNSVSY